MSAIQEGWDSFCKKVYPQGMHPQQALQLKDSFFAGFLVCLTNMIILGEGDETIGVIELEKYRQEAYAYMEEAKNRT